ncbi:MAG: electron transfer flavoprotein subunit alpha/FixB family protein [bacterium]
MAVLVFAESVDGKFKKSTYEAVSYAKETANQLGTKVVAVSIGNVDEADMKALGDNGAETVYAVSLNKFTPEAYSTTIADIAKKEDVKVVVVSNSYTGKSITPRIAVKLNASVASGVVSLPDTSSGFVVRQGVFSGKAFADVDLTSDVKVLAITPNSYQINNYGGEANVINHDAGLGDDVWKTQIVETNRVTGKIPLTEAELVVSGGRGLKGPENWSMVEDFAEVLGAATACSKPVSDMEWRPHEEHVGQTGITIKPNLYIAIGISGAIQHLAGVSSSKVIVAINKDPEAPFFKAADYGIVGDAFEVVPKLIEAAKNLKSASA